MIRRALLAVFALFALCAGAAARAAELPPADPNGHRNPYVVPFLAAGDSCRNGWSCLGPPGGTLAPTCDVTLDPADGETALESAINGVTAGGDGVPVVCVPPGAYTTAIVDITKDCSAITDGCWFIYKRASDTDDEPWFQVPADQAKFTRIKIAGKKWRFHRITVDGDGTSSPRIDVLSGADDNIFNRVLSEDGSNRNGLIVRGALRTIFQYGVVRDAGPLVGADLECVNLVSGPHDTRILDSEIYDCSGSQLDLGNGSHQGTILWNNDVYVTSALYTDCSGTFTIAGPCSASEGGITGKSYASAADPVIVGHNRVQGLRKTDTNACCISGTAGHAIALSDDSSGAAQYRHLINNVVRDSQGGIAFTASHPSPAAGTQKNNSIIGNYFDEIKRFNSNEISRVFRIGGRADNSEIYFNTAIDSASLGMITNSGNGKYDFRCNVFVNNGPDEGDDTPDADTLVDDQLFFQTTKVTSESPSNNIEKTIGTVLRSTHYDKGTILQTGAITRDGGTGDQLYVVIGFTNGQNTCASCLTAASAPTYTTRLNSQVLDGDIWLVNFATHLKQFRKHRTVVGGEAYYLPRARFAPPTTEADHPLNPDPANTYRVYTACPTDFAARTDLGINNATDFTDATFSPNLVGEQR